MAKSPKKPAVYPRGSIVPSAPVPIKSKGSETETTETGKGFPLKPGFVVQDASGNQFVMNDWPNTGGPWGPAWSNTANGGAGGFVWTNEGA